MAKARKKKAPKKKGHVPVEVLNKRLRRLNNIVAKRRGGKPLA